MRYVCDTALSSLSSLVCRVSMFLDKHEYIIINVGSGYISNQSMLVHFEKSVTISWKHKLELQIISCNFHG